MGAARPLHPKGHEPATLRLPKACPLHGPSPSPPDMSQLAPLVEKTKGLQPWRRVFHAANGVAIVFVLAVLKPAWGLVVGALGAIALGLLLLDGLRFLIPPLNRTFFRLLRPFASPREAKGLASSTWFMMGAFLSAAVFPWRVTVPALLVLALADPAASYVGRRWGRRTFGTGTVEGSLVFLTVSLAILVTVAGPWVGSGVAILVTLGERIPWPLDDNLTIPLLTGTLLWSLLPFWG